MAHTVKYKLYPNEGDIEMPNCYVNAYHTVISNLPGGCGASMVIKAWKELTGSTLKLSYNNTLFTVTFASEADELFFRLKYS